jgi:hypothetical protein
MYLKNNNTYNKNRRKKELTKLTIDQLPKTHIHIVPNNNLMNTNKKHILFSYFFSKGITTEHGIKQDLSPPSDMSDRDEEYQIYR